jgi:S1-C subfamily serine protease
MQMRIQKQQVLRGMTGLLALSVLAAPFVATGADRAWEFQGELVSLKPGNEAVAIFQLPDKTRIEVPLVALSNEGRDAIREVLDSAPSADGKDVVTARGPLGKSVALAVPVVIKAVETDAIWCSSAEEAVLVYHLYLAGESLSADERSAAESRLSQWQKLAAEKRVRMGSEWVLPADRERIQREAGEMLQHAMQLLKSGNTKGSESELVKASRLDPENGRAEFVLGLAYALGGNLAEATEHFADACRRDPHDPWAVTNLAVCDYNAGRYGGVPARFRKVLDMVPDSQLVADNLGIASVVLDTNKPKATVPAKVRADLNDLYRQVVQQLKLQPVENAASRKLSYATPYGKGCSAGPAASLQVFLEPPREWVAGSRVASGVVIADGRILTSRRVLGEMGEVWVEDPASPGRRVAAVEVASLENPPVTLLRCEGLSVSPLPVAEKMPALGTEVMAAMRVEGPLFGSKPASGVGKLMSPTRADLDGCFIHSAAIPRGSDGGPIVDTTGRIVGLVAKAPRADASGGSLGLGYPVEGIWPLLKEQLSDLQPAQPGDPVPAWDTIQGRAAAATVRVMFVEKRIKPKTP